MLGNRRRKLATVSLAVSNLGFTPTAVSWAVVNSQSATSTDMDSNNKGTSWYTLPVSLSQTLLMTGYSLAVVKFS